MKEVLDGWANATTGARDVAGLLRSSASDLSLIASGLLVKDGGLKRLPSLAASVIAGYADATKIMLTSVIQRELRRVVVLCDIDTPPMTLLERILHTYLWGTD